MVDWERGVTWFGRVVCGDVVYYTLDFCTAEASKFLACGGNNQFTGRFWRFIMELLHVHISFSGNTFVWVMLRVSVIEVIHH
jgi:hypothetical protein